MPANNNLKLINSVIRHPLLYLFLTNIIIRLPHIPHAQGDDAFIVVWMAKAIQKGYLEIWLMHPLSLFGFYPYSVYPIGGPLILSLIFNFGFSVDSSLIIFSYFFTFISIITSYYLGTVLFPGKKISIFFFVLFFSTSPIFLRITFWTASVRGPFLAILPLTIAFNLKLIKQSNRKNFILLIASIVLLSFMHRLIILYPFFIISIALGLVMTRYDLSKNMCVSSWLIAYFFAFIIGLLVFPVDPRKTAEFILANDTILGLSWNLIIDYILRFSLISLIAIFGFISKLRVYEQNEGEKSILISFLILGGILAFLAPVSKYASIIAIPWFSYFAVFGFNSIITWRPAWLKYSIGIAPFLFGWLYSIIVVPMTIYIVLGFFLMMYSILETGLRPEDINSRTTTRFFTITCCTVAIMSLISVDGLLTSASEEFPFAYVSDDEFQIAEYLKQENHEGKIIIVYHEDVARRIQALTFQPVLFPENDPASLYNGWITKEEILNYTYIDLDIFFTLGTPFQVNLTNVESKLRSEILGLDLNSSYGQNKSQNLGIGFVITGIHASGFYITSYGEIKTPFFTSIIENGIRRLETRYLCLYEIPDFVSTNM